MLEGWLSYYIHVGILEPRMKSEKPVVGRLSVKKIMSRLLTLVVVVVLGVWLIGVFG